MNLSWCIGKEIRICCPHCEFVLTTGLLKDLYLTGILNLLVLLFPYHIENRCSFNLSEFVLIAGLFRVLHIAGILPLLAPLCSIWIKDILSYRPLGFCPHYIDIHTLTCRRDPDTEWDCSMFNKSIILTFLYSKYFLRFNFPCEQHIRFFRYTQFVCKMEAFI